MATLQFLLLEDKLQDTEVIQAALTEGSMDYQLRRVDTRADFVTALETDGFDLILAAYAMPGFDGIAALEIAGDLAPDLPFIFVSASLGEELAIEALKRGATDYVLKQRLERLVPCVQRALREAQERRERQRAEDMLRQNEDRLRTVAANLPNGAVFVVDRDLGYLLAEGNAIQAAGMTSGDLVGKTLWEALDPDLATRYEPLYRQALSGEPFSLEHCSHNRYYITHGTPLRNERGEVDTVLSVSYDISDRKQAEAQLRESEERYRSLFNSIDEGFCTIEVLYDADGKPFDHRILQANPAFQKQTGLENSEGKTASELMPGVEQDWNDLYAQVIETGESMRVEYRSEVFDRWFDVLLSRIGDAATHRVAVVFTDITDRKQSEAALRESEELKQSILESSRDCLKVLTLDSRVSYISPGGLSLLEIDDPTSILNTVWADKWQGEDYEKAKAAIAAATRGNTGQFQGYLPTAKGTPKWWDTIITPVRDAAGQVVQLVTIARDITVARRLQCALQESEEQSRNILESITDAFFALSEDWRFTYANAATETLLDRTRDDLIGKSLWEEYPGLNGSDFEPIYRDTMRDRVAGSLTEFYPDHDRWYDVRTYPAANGITVYFRNVTDRIQAEAALRESEEKNRNVLESIAEAFFALDENWRITYINPSGEALLDRLPGDLIGKNFWEEYPGVTGSEFETIYRRTMSDRVPGTLTAFYPDHARWYNVRTYPAPNGITVYFNNVTDLKQAEAALRQSESRFRLMVESAKDYAIFTLDLNGVVTSWNSGAERLLGYSEAEIIGRNGRITFTPEDNERGQSERERQIALTQGRAENERWHMRKDGSRFWGSGLVRPLQDEAGITQGFVKIMQDKTAQRQSQAEREQLLQREQAAREEAERANRIKDEFLAVLSHELRSPLNPILGWTHLLQLGKLDAARQTEALKIIERNAKLQAQLIEDLLDISRIMQGKLSLTATPVSLTLVISSALETVRLAAEAKNIQITLDLDPKIAPISGDAARLQQVVWNLLTNAVKFTPNGGQVVVELRQLDRQVQIRVTDTGKGITPNFLPHVFEYFRQEDGSTTREFGGLGLGLAIVRQIVEMHGGTVWAESLGENQGATFIVQLSAMQQAALTISEPTPTQADAEMPLDNIQILLVDDEPDTREFQAFLLEQNGAIVTRVASGLEALQALDRFIPDAIVSDVGMAQMDGYMLIGQIRLRPAERGGTIPAIALTAYAAEVDQQKALQVGFQAHITKPVEPGVLVKAIANLCLRNQLQG